ncbi:MAG TPA: plastocyanin/azurin family copper-binding protein [Solirubrobacterales bacterium]|nr:plastocyanin/azurin family copper-binding protein [Solirubrobacterales bacterium]
MSNETLFYICGCVLAVSAVSVSLIGLKLRDFPGKFLPVIVLWFALFVGGATTFAVLHAQDEEKAKAAELHEAGEEIEKGQTSGPYENEGGAQGGESEELEEQAEKEAEGSVQGEEPVGPTEGETGKKESGGGASTTLDLEASETALAFDTTKLTAKAGQVTIDFNNPSAIPHNVVIEQNGKEISGFEPIAEGEESETADLKPGTYTFFCSVPGHRQAGMEGTLVVK